MVLYMTLLPITPKQINLSGVEGSVYSPVFWRAACCECQTAHLALLKESVGSRVEWTSIQGRIDAFWESRQLLQKLGCLCKAGCTLNNCPEQDALLNRGHRFHEKVLLPYRRERLIFFPHEHSIHDKCL